MADWVIQASDATKTFRGGVVAVSGLDLQIERGAVYGLIGRNGAGKTTTLKMLMGLLRPDRGTARMLGWNLWQAPREVRARVAYVSQRQQVYAWMTLGELCRYTACLYANWDRDYARELARRWTLGWNRAVGAMSGGEQRKVAMLLAFASRADVLILDEPAASLDPIARREMIDEILEALTRRDGCTVLFSTHQIGDLERITEHVGFMDRGRLTLSERLEELQQRYRRVQVVFPSASPPLDFAVPGAVRSQTAGPVVTAIIRQTNDGQLDAVRARPGVRVNVFRIGLEDIFIELFGRNEEAEASAPIASSEDESVETAPKIISMS